MVKYSTILIGLFFSSCVLTQKVSKYENPTFGRTKLIIKPNGKYKLINYGRSFYKLSIEKGVWEECKTKENIFIILRAENEIKLADTLYVKNDDYNKLFIFDTIESDFYRCLNRKTCASLLHPPHR